MNPSSPKSQTSFAYSRLRQDVVAGRLAPGEKLKIAELATALDVSPGAIREALSRLVPEQLVISRDQKGFVVAPLSISDLEDLTNLRCEIEAIALRRSVRNGDDGWEAAILASAHRLRRTKMVSPTDKSLTPEWVERHAEFHAALVSACGSRRLLELHTQLYEQAERYRGLSLRPKFDLEAEAEPDLESNRNVSEEHQALVDAALDRDADRLVTLATAHFRTTASLITEAATRSSAESIAQEQ